MLAQEWCYPLIACQTVTASSIASVLVVCLSFSLSLVLFLLSSLTVSSLPSFHQYLRATHPLATPTHGTPARKRGVRNVIAPLRRVSWYKAVLLLLILLSSSSRPLPVKNVCPEGTSDQSVLRVEFVTQLPSPRSFVYKSHLKRYRGRIPS